VPHLLLGVLLITSCTTGAVVWSLNLGDRRAALVLARPVALGDTLEPGDLREVSVALDPGVDAIPASDAPSVVGRTAAANLPAGLLLPRGALGASPLPGDGRAIAALAVQPGQVSPDVHAGARVLVVRTADPNTDPNAEPADSGGATPTSSWPGVVIGVAAMANDQERVVSVELTEPDARQVAAAPAGHLSVVLVTGGER
jgi:hypothetical protein